VRVKFIKYGKRMIGSDGQSEYFEVSVEAAIGEDPVDCARRAKAFVREQLREEEAAAPLSASIGDRVSASKSGA